VHMSAVRNNYSRKSFVGGLDEKKARFEDPQLGGRLLDSEWTGTVHARCMGMQHSVRRDVEDVEDP
jgi:hypothetical protein